MPETLTKPPLFDPAALRARLMGRSYWALLMTDGTIIPEWQVDWTLAPQKGRRALRLYGPNGQMATLDDGKDATGRLFQFKVALATSSVARGEGRTTLAHVIGLIRGTDGQCDCVAYDYRTGQMTAFCDNAYNMRYEQVGPLSTDHLGLVPA